MKFIINLLIILTYEKIKIFLTSYFLLLISYLVFLISCSNKPPEIYHLQDSYNTRFYVINNYKDNENCIRFIFNFAKNNSGRLQILTDKNTFIFEDNIDFLKDITKQRFSFSRNGKSFRNNYIKVNFLENTPIHFIIEETEDQKQLIADFDSLTVNTVQNFLDYAEKDETKKEHETYSYILLNKNKVEKMKLIYHEYRAWFEVEVF